jgi:hypothetical protein
MFSVWLLIRHFIYYPDSGGVVKSNGKPSAVNFHAIQVMYIKALLQWIMASIPANRDIQLTKLANRLAQISADAVLHFARLRVKTN